MAKKSVFKKIKTDAVYRCRFFLTVTTIWNLMLFVYYIILGVIDTLTSNVEFSWYVGLANWYGLICFFRILIWIKAFKLDNSKHIDFKLVTIVYLFLCIAQIYAITITPAFFVAMFSDKFEFTLSSLIVNTINLVLFIISLIPVKRQGFSYNEAEFIQCRKYIGITEGFFTILIIAISILLLLKPYFFSNNDNLIGYVYFAIGTAFTVGLLVLAIKQIKARKKDKKWEKNRNL